MYTSVKILFHSYGKSHCPDGFTSAWVAHRYFRLYHPAAKVEFHPVEYQQSERDYELLLSTFDFREDDTVYLLDWSVPRSVTEKLMRMTKELIIIDHHKTAIEGIMGLSSRFLLDSSKSGAMLTWEYFFPDESAPTLIDYVMDRDIWKKELPYTEEMHLALGMFRQSFHAFDFLGSLDANDYIDLLLPIGTKLMEERRQQIYAECHKAILGKLPVAREIKSWVVGIIPDCNPSLVSDALNELCLVNENIHFAASYRAREEGGYKVELRSTRENVDVSAIAKQYGGGGHYHAAGFICDKLPFIF